MNSKLSSLFPQGALNLTGHLLGESCSRGRRHFSVISTRRDAGAAVNGHHRCVVRRLRTSNPIENLNGSVAHFSRNVRGWKDASMILRWVAGAVSDAGGRFRKLHCFAEMRTLLKALDHRAPGEHIQASRKVA